MNIATSQPHVRLAVTLGGALVALGCGSTEPTRSNAPRSDPTEHVGLEPATTTNNALGRVVGYLPTYRSLEPSAVDLDALTHLTLGFAAPLDSTQAGSPLDFVIDATDLPSLRDSRAVAVAKLVEAAHDKHVKVLGSLGGGGAGGPPVAASLALDAEAFVTATLAFLDRFGLDGIDIDIEGEAIDPVTYEKLIDGLAARLPEGKLLTAAVSNYMKQNYRALDKVDFISVMSYDQCGNCRERAPHSTYEQAALDLDYWSNDYWHTAGKDYDKANILLAVPFYGYCWGTGCTALTRSSQAGPVALTYQQILSFWNTSRPESKEPVPDLIVDEAADYYVSLNGPQTIESKATLAKGYGGITIWELGQDAKDATGSGSLLSAIESAE